MEEPPTERHKRGDTREDGMRFWSYTRKKEYWVPAEQFDEKQTKEARRKANRPRSQTSGLKRGDTREDGCIFWAYRLSCAGGEHWVSPQKFQVMRERHNARYRRYNRENPLYRLTKAIRRMTYRAAKYAGVAKPSRACELLGTDTGTFAAHIESQFTEGMAWENQGEWHIDHIIPLASGKTPEEIWKLCHYTNLQPLWGPDNLIKGARMPDALP